MSQQGIHRKQLREYDRDSIKRYLCELARRLGKTTLSCRDLKIEKELSPATVIRKFGSWSRAMQEAGLGVVRAYKPDPEAMLRELASLMQRLGREPRKAEIDAELTMKSRNYIAAFGSLSAAFDAAESRVTPIQSPSRQLPVFSLQKAQRRKRRRYGPAMQFRGLRHEPINELGVVFLFGMLAQELGFEVESVQAGFPDCDAKYKLEDGTFERVAIEFEYKSSAFKLHQHNSDECDFLVCWEHDWVSVPRGIQVIELRVIVRKLGGECDGASNARSQ